MYSTRDGRMTPTAPTYEDMRIETSLSMTPEDSLEGLSAAVGGTEGDQVRSPIATNVKGIGNNSCTSWFCRNQTQDSQ